MWNKTNSIVNGRFRLIATVSSWIWLQMTESSNVQWHKKQNRQKCIVAEWELYLPPTLHPEHILPASKSIFIGAVNQWMITLHAWSPGLDPQDCINQEWWCSLVSLALRRYREGVQKLKTIFSYIATSRANWDTWDTISKTRLRTTKSILQLILMSILDPSL